MLRIKNAQIFNGDSFISNETVHIYGERIVSASKNSTVHREIDAEGHILCPGFIDIQVNGGGGFSFNENTTKESLKTILKTHLNFGTTSILPTLITDSFPKMQQALTVVSDCMKDQERGILGIHLEGPYINALKKGIHDEKFIRMLSSEEIRRIYESNVPLVLVTLAPEVCSQDLISNLINKNIFVFAGHSNATGIEIKNAVSLGIRGVTHLFNACSQLTSRDSGVVGAALLNPSLWCAIIVDGHHVCTESLELAFKVKDKKKIILVSDAMAAVGTQLKEFSIAKEKIFVKENKYINAQGILAGASLTMWQSVQNVIKFKLATLAEALRMATLNPAECLKIDHQKGRIAPGYDADLLVLHKDTLQTIRVIQLGEEIPLL